MSATKMHDLTQKLCLQTLSLSEMDIKQLDDELGFLERSVRNTINSMRVDQYGVEWKEYIGYKYLLRALQKIIVPIQRNRIVIHHTFEKDFPLMRENGKMINFEVISKDEESFVIELVNYTPKQDEVLLYGTNKVSWEFKNRGVTINKKTYIENEKGKKFEPRRIIKRGNRYILFFDVGSEFSGEKLYIDGEEVNFRVENVDYDFKGLWVYSDKDNKKTPIKINYARVGSRQIETDEKIRSRYVIDDRGNIFSFKLLPKENTSMKNEGVWIAIEDNDDMESIEGRVKRDIFIELLYAAMDLEVWESPNLDPKPNKDNEKKIKVKRVLQEEARLLLERKPKTVVIYPPKSTYQLNMQRNAVQTLLYRPAPQHLPLLNIFLDREKIPFETNIKYKETVKWEFLTESDREGTEEQRDFVKKALATPEFTILEGPPGSGKTTAITELIYQLLKEGKRVLLSASTHVAVDNVIEKLHEHFGEDLMNRGIVPLRIGREEVISEVIRKYQIDYRKNKIKDVLSRYGWFNSMTPEEQERTLNDIVVRSSNLVCGTTIGILQYPPFKEKRDKFFEPEFDYMIIDEASKTTFLEFLVPAVHAKRWILVGDVKQLSPYTDTLQIRVLIDKTISDDYLKKALLAYNILIFDRRPARGYDFPKIIYIDDREVIEHIAKFFKRKLEEGYGGNRIKIKTKIENGTLFVLSRRSCTDVKRHMGAQYFDRMVICEEELNYEHSLAMLISKDTLFVDKDVFKRHHDKFPWTHILISSEKFGYLVHHNFAHLWWYRRAEKIGGKKPYAMRYKRENYYEYDEIQEAIRKNFEERDWANELAWRLKRIQELEYEKQEEGSKRYYRASVFSLMPPKQNDSRQNPYKQIRKIAQLWMPSILKSLQEGITPEWKDKEIKTCFSHGLPEDAKKERFSSIPYQHRMHPDISYIPRKLFYDNEKLKDDSFVSGSGREWGYKGYRRHVVWINIPRKLRGARVHRNVNKAEAQAIIRELQKFLEWNEKQPEKYRVIILSFYEAQRKKIRDLLREKYPDNSRKQTRFTIKGTDVRVYTVDRVQGKEGDIVFLSMVRNSGSVGFMDSPNRLNVAITRAKYQLVIFGDIEFFSNQKQSPSLRNIVMKIKNNFEVIEYE